MQDFSFRWETTIEAITHEDWNRCFQNRSPASSFEYNFSLENSLRNDYKFHYLIVENATHIVAIFGCFEFDYAIETLTKGIVRRIILAIKKSYPKFLTIKAFFAGHLTAVCDHLMGFDLNLLNENDQHLILLKAVEQIKKKAAEKKSAITIFKEFSKEEKEKYELLLNKDLVFAFSLPGAQLSLKPNVLYVDQIKSKYKNILKNRKNKFDSFNLKMELLYDAKPYKDDIYRMYRNLLAEAEVKFEMLNADFFVNVLEDVPNAFLIIVKQDDEKVVGFSFNLESDDSLYGLYMGYENRIRESNIYFNLFYKVIDEAIARNKEKIFLGQTSYDVKLGLGATLNDLYLGVHSNNKLMRFMLRNFKKYIFPKTKTKARNVWAKTNS